MPDPAPAAPVAGPQTDTVPLAAFARAIGPHLETTMVSRGGRTVPQTRVIRPGSDDEIWLKLLRMRHPNERHSIAGWHKLIDRYRNEPAHPHDPRFGR